jgi:hypothetical protein
MCAILGSIDWTGWPHTAGSRVRDQSRGCRDPNKGVWVQTASLLAARAWYGAAVQANGDVLVIGGVSGGDRLMSVERYR